jgi:hypothetical protein
MKLVAASLALGFLLMGSSAQAGLFGSNDKLPKPVDYPIVRPKLKETHKIPHMVHPAKYQSHQWGAVRIDRSPPRPLAHYMTQ